MFLPSSFRLFKTGGLVDTISLTVSINQVKACHLGGGWVMVVGGGGGVTLSMRAEASAILTSKIRRIQWLYVVQTSGWRTNYYAKNPLIYAKLSNMESKKMVIREIILKVNLFWDLRMQAIENILKNPEHVDNVPIRNRKSGL